MRPFLIALIIGMSVYCFSGVHAQMLNPLATQLTENGVDTVETISPEEEVVKSAPLKVLFKANIGELPAGITSYHCEWDFATDSEFHLPFLIRYDEDTEYTFEQSGIYYIRLQVTYIKNDGTEDMTDVSGSFIIRISESELKVPNAFSPNGDGINDVFKVTYKSLVKFNAYIFNRWGQQLYQWGLDQIDEGWDGTTHGKPVKDGVYFIVIEAEGSDGVKYKKKSDINILRGFSGSGITAQ